MDYELKNIKDTRIKLIIAGVLPGTSDFQDKDGKRWDSDAYEITHSKIKQKRLITTWNNFMRKYPDTIAIDWNIRNGVIYNKKYQHLVDDYHRMNNSREENHIEFGKLMGYYPIDLSKLNYRKPVIVVRFIDGNEIEFLSYWKPKNTTLTKEHLLLKKMKKIDPSIRLETRLDYP